MAQWYWKKDLRLLETKDDAWEPYEAAQSAKIEKAYGAKQKTMSLNSTYTIDFKDMVQFRKGEKDRQRPIKRVADAASSGTAAPAATTPAVSASSGGSGSAASNSTLRASGTCEVFRFTENVKDFAKALALNLDEEGFPETVILDPLLPSLPAEAKKIRYGDLVYFDDYRGVGLYAVGLKQGKLSLIKTLGEYGYELPVELRHIPRSYYVLDDTITMGFEIIDEGEGEAEN